MIVIYRLNMAVESYLLVTYCPSQNTCQTCDECYIYLHFSKLQEVTNSVNPLVTRAPESDVVIHPPIIALHMHLVLFLYEKPNLHILLSRNHWSSVRSLMMVYTCTNHCHGFSLLPLEDAKQLPSASRYS